MDESGELSPGEIVFRRDASSAPDPMSSPFGDVSLFTEEMAEPAPLDPAEALALMRRSRAPEKGYGLVVSGVDAAAKRDVAAGIIARLLGISQPQALEMCKQAVIPVLDRVEKSRAEEARLLFEAENIPAKVTAGNS